ncbi:MAG: IS3 family transposase [Verrucomicrobiales bacterium]
MRDWLGRRRLISRVSAKGYCYDNATCESFIATLKRESFPTGCTFETKAQARRTIFEYIETFYKPVRIHTALENTAPNQFLTKHFHSESITLN